MEAKNQRDFLMNCNSLPCVRKKLAFDALTILSWLVGSSNKLEGVERRVETEKSTVQRLYSRPLGTRGIIMIAGFIFFFYLPYLGCKA